MHSKDYPPRYKDSREETHMMVDLPMRPPRDAFAGLDEVVDALIYYTPILIIIGVAGNCLAALVFRTSPLWRQSTSRYLTALAVTDSCFLAQLSVTWLDAAGWSGVFNRPGVCQATVYASYVTCNLSAWLVVAFTFERLVAVRCPLRRRGVCTVRRATAAIRLLSALALAGNLPVLLFAKAAPHCNLDTRYRRLADAFNLLDTLFSFTIPLAAIVLMNMAICGYLVRSRRQRRRLAPGGRSPADHYKVNGMLLTVSSVFVLLNLPAYMIRLLAYKFDAKMPNPRRPKTLAIKRPVFVQHSLRRGLRIPAPEEILAQRLLRQQPTLREPMEEAAEEVNQPETLTRVQRLTTFFSSFMNVFCCGNRRSAANAVAELRQSRVAARMANPLPLIFSLRGQPVPAPPQSDVEAVEEIPTPPPPPSPSCIPPVMPPLPHLTPVAPLSLESSPQAPFCCFI